jgi:hypothetical protein
MKSKKASARVTSAKRETAAAGRAARRTTRRTSVARGAAGKVAARQFQKSGAKRIQAHIAARGRRQQARRDSR